MSHRRDNIYKRKDGRWEGHYIAEFTLNGKAIYKSFYAKNYTEVKEKLFSKVTVKQPIITKTTLGIM